MKILFKNTLTGKKEEFKPINKNIVKMYNCGPTVYSRAHIGNLRAYIFADLLKRVLHDYGYKVIQVINITDVGHLTDDSDNGDDKIEIAAKKQKLTAKQITEKYTRLFKSDLKKLNINIEDINFPEATSYIDKQISMIKSLEKKGYTYKTKDGIYYDTSKFKEYGKLGNINLKNIKEGARIELKDKKNKTDFALWKFSNPNEKRQQEWDSPWGIGFPGWHIECSSMIWDILGEHIDIHTGGIEHIPIHHNNEIAQSEALFGPNLANYWLHINHLLVDGGKMSKSLGNIVDLDDIEEFRYTGDEFRFFILSAHYRNHINFTKESIKSSKNALSKLRSHFKTDIDPEKIIPSKNNKYANAFLEKIYDDLNTPEAVAVIFEFAKQNINEKEKLQTAKLFENILGIKLITKKDCIDLDDLPADIKKLIKERNIAKANKEYIKSDEIREKIKSMGYMIIDNKNGICIKKL